MTPERARERSVDSLQRVYAIIIALAINESIKRVFLRSNSIDLEFHLDYLPQFIAFICTAVPFVHSMNRHMDKTLAKFKENQEYKLFAILVADFAIFLVESCVLFLLGVSVTHGIFFFQLWMLLLAIDLAWAFVSYPITKPVIAEWAAINLLSVEAALVIIYCLDGRPLLPRIWMLVAVAFLRPTLEYYFTREFYFPRDAPT